MNCRICNSKIEEPFLSLGSSPLANSYISKENIYEKEEYYPLDLYVCSNPDCRLVQAKDYVSSSTIFSPDYAYFSSYSETWNKHCKDYVDKIVKKLNLLQNSKVIEIGSNDGCLIQHFKKYNIDAVGIDPASDAAHEALKKKIYTYISFFNTNFATNTFSPNSVDLIIGNNVLAHNPDLNDFVRGMKYLLRENGTITIEFPHLLNLIQSNQFDTIYHEHFSYLSLLSVMRLFNQNELEIYDVEEIPTHGGSLRIYIRHKNKKDNDQIIDLYLKDHKFTKINVKNILDKEIEFGLSDLQTYYDFSESVKIMKQNILNFLIELKKKNKKIIGYGAPAKGNTLFNYCGIGRDFINYTVDKNPYKQNKFLPGTHIPIYSPNIIEKDKPDYIIILPWNIKEEIIKQLEYTKKWNCKLVILIPKIEIIS